MKLYFTKFYFILLLLLVGVKGYGQSPISYTSNPAIGQWHTDATPPCSSSNTHLLNIVHSRVSGFTANGTPQFQTKRINNSSFSPGGQIQTTWVTDYDCSFNQSQPTYSAGTTIISSQGGSTYGGVDREMYRIGLKSNTGDKIAGGSFTVNRTWVAAPTILSPSNNATNVSLTPTLTWQAANGTGIQYRVSVSQNGTTIHPSSGFQTTTSYTVPSGVLQTGQTYQVNVMASFGSSTNTSYWSPIATHTFTTLASSGGGGGSGVSILSVTGLPTSQVVPASGGTYNAVVSNTGGNNTLIDWFGEGRINGSTSPTQFNFSPPDQYGLLAGTSTNVTVTIQPNTSTTTRNVRVTFAEYGGGTEINYNWTQQGTTATPCTVPPAPTGLVGSVTSSNQILLTWDDWGGYADYHTVERSTSPTGSWTVVSTSNTQLRYTDNPPTGTYYYRVKGCVNCGQCSAYASVVGPYSNVPTPTTGIAQVSIAPTAVISVGGQWKFTDQTTWRNNNENVTRNAGNYTIEFKPVTGWTTPANQSVTILANTTTNKTGTYIQIPTSNIICGTFTINPTTLRQGQDGFMKVNVANAGNAAYVGNLKLVWTSLATNVAITLDEYTGRINPSRAIQLDRPNSMIQSPAGNYKLSVVKTDNGIQTELCSRNVSVTSDYVLSCSLSAPTSLTQGQVTSFTSNVTCTSGTFNGKLELLWWENSNPAGTTALDTKNIGLGAGQNTSLTRRSNPITSAPGIYTLAIKVTGSNGITQILCSQTVTINPNNAISTLVPSIVFSPMDGNLIQSRACANQPTSTQATPVSFWQRSTCHGLGHSSAGGINQADDTYAWDVNKNYPSHNSDANEPVYAVADGIIMNNSEALGWGGPSYGQVLIQHTDGTNVWYSGYLHLHNITSKKNQPTQAQRTVRAGEQIGTVGKKGGDNYHLHFAVYTRNSAGKFVSQNTTIVPRNQVITPSLVSSTDGTGNNVTHSTVPAGINFKFTKNNITNSVTYKLRIRKFQTGTTPPTSDVGVAEVNVTDIDASQLDKYLSASTLASMTPLQGGGTMALEMGYSYRWIVKATSISNPSVVKESGSFSFAISNQSIAVNPDLNILEKWVVGTTYEIKWQTTNYSSDIKIEYWNGERFITATTENSTRKPSDVVYSDGFTPNDGSFFFTVPKAFQNNNAGNVRLSGRDWTIPSTTFRVDKVEPEFGVTVIVHGFSLFGSSVENSWMFKMGMAIKERAGGGVILINDGGSLNRSGEWFIAPNQEGINFNGEIILLYNWMEDSDELNNGYAEAAGDNLFASLLSPSGLPSSSPRIGYNDFVQRWNVSKTFLLDKKKHFICHSRGNIVALHAFYRMQKHFPNIKIEHYTALDPHPATPMNDGAAPFVFGSGNNTEIDISPNILKADNYFRKTDVYEPLNGNYSGVTFFNHFTNIYNLNNDLLVGAYTNNLTAKQHSNVHLWYFGTINNNIDATNGEFQVPNSWYTNGFNGGGVIPYMRHREGYNRSRIGSKNIDLTETTIVSTNINNYPNPPSLFNGDFAYRGGAVGKSPAWNYHGGTTSDMEISLGIATPNAIALRTKFSAKHNYLYFPIAETHISFETMSSVGFSTLSKVEVNGVRYDVGSSWQTVNVPIRNYEIGRTSTFEIKSTLAMVKNVRFTVAPRNIASSQVTNIIASNLSGGNIARKQTYMDSLAWEYSSLSSDANGRSTFNFYPPLMVSDSIKLDIAGFEPLKTSLDTITLSHTNMPIPMLHTATPTTLIQYPKIKILNNQSVLTTPLATLNIKANNLVGGKIYNISDSLGSVQMFSGAESTLDFTAFNVGYNTLRAELRSNEDTVYQVLQIAYVPDSLDAEWTYNVYLNSNAAGQNAMMYIDDQFVKEMTDFTERIPVLRGSHKFTFIKRGYKTLQFMVDSSTTLAVSMEERNYQTENDSVSFDNNVNYVRYWNGMSIKNQRTESIYSAKRSSPDFSNQGLVRRTEWFEINKTAGTTPDVVDIIVAPEQAEDVNLTTSYLLRKGDGVYSKTFPSQFTDLVGFDTTTQNKLFIHGITTNYSAFGLFKAQAPIVNAVSMLEAQTGYTKTYHKHQLFWYPDSLQIGLKYLSASSSNPNFTYEVVANGDSIRVKFNNCFVGIAQVSFVAEHDGLTSTNTVSINVVPNSNLAAQVTVERDSVCLNEVNNITVITEIGKKYRLFLQGNLIGTPRIGTGSPIVFSTGSLTTAGLNTFLVTVEDIETTCLDTLATQPTVFVNDLPAQPTGNILHSVCRFETVPAFVTTGTFRKEWYADSLGNNLLGTGNSYTLPQNTSQIVGAYSVYVAQFDPITGCRSLLKKITLNVRPLPVFELNSMIDTDNSGSFVTTNGVVEVCRPNQIAFNARRVFPTGHSFFWTNTQSVSAQFTATNSTNLILKVTVDSTGCSFSDTLNINFYNPPTANDLNTSVAQYCSGDTPVKIVGSLPREGNGIYAYQWQKRNATTNNLWENIPNETTRDLIFTDSLTETTAYRRNVSSVCDVMSNIITLEYIAKPIVQMFVNGQVLTQDYVYKTCPSPQSPITQVGDTIRATTTSGELWWYSNNILFARGRDYFVIEEGMGNTDIRVIAKNEICEDTTFTVSIRKEPSIEFFFRADKEIICTNDTSTLTLEILSPSANQDYTFEWLKDGQAISSGTDRTLQTNEAGEYQVIISSSTCQLTTHTLTIETLPTPNIDISFSVNGTTMPVTDTIRICQGSILEFGIAQTTPNTDYSWFINNRYQAGSTVRITTNSTLQLRASNGTCSKQSEFVTIIFDSNVVPLLSQVREISCKSDLAFEVQSSITGRFEVTSSDTSFVINGNRLRINPQDLPAGNYTVKSNYAGLNVCLHPDAVATFSIKEELIIPTIIERDGILVVDSLMNNYTYQWEYSENNADWEAIGTGSSISLTNNGFYRVKVSLVNGETCFVYSESRSITSIQTPILGTEEMSKNSVNLYPNPSEGDFTLELSTEWKVDATKIKIVDALGRVLATKNVKDYKTFISHNLNSGIYFIQIQNENQTLTLKLVIQK